MPRDPRIGVTNNRVSNTFPMMVRMFDDFIDVMRVPDFFVFVNGLNGFFGRPILINGKYILIYDKNFATVRLFLLCFFIF